MWNHVCRDGIGADMRDSEEEIISTKSGVGKTVSTKDSHEFSVSEFLPSEKNINEK